jgi:hypothetical protein
MERRIINPFMLPALLAGLAARGKHTGGFCVGRQGLGRCQPMQCYCVCQ